MKCDELKSYKPSDLLFSGFSVCKKEDVDEVIAELKSEINRKNGVCKRWFERCMKSRAKERRLKRALYKACANWAMAESYSVLNDVLTANRWVHTLRKLNAKLEEYK